jgi:hypothetical protein
MYPKSECHNPPPKTSIVRTESLSKSGKNWNWHGTFRHVSSLGRWTFVGTLVRLKSSKPFKISDPPINTLPFKFSFDLIPDPSPNLERPVPSITETLKMTAPQIGIRSQKMSKFIHHVISLFIPSSCFAVRLRHNISLFFNSFIQSNSSKFTPICPISILCSNKSSHSNVRLIIFLNWPKNNHWQSIFTHVWWLKQQNKNNDPKMWNSLPGRKDHQSKNRFAGLKPRSSNAIEKVSEDGWMDGWMASVWSWWFWCPDLWFPWQKTDQKLWIKTILDRFSALKWSFYLWFLFLRIMNKK